MVEINYKGPVLVATPLNPNCFSEKYFSVVIYLSKVTTCFIRKFGPKA